MIKRWFYQEILSENTVELKTGVADTVRRLDELELTPHRGTGGPAALYCVCDGKGRIYAGWERRRASKEIRPVDLAAAQCYLQGQVYSEEGRTKVYYRVVYDKGRRAWLYVSVALMALFAAIGVVLAGYALLSGAKVSTYEDGEFLALVGVAVAVTLASLFGVRKTVKPTAAPPELEAFLLERLDAVENWDR